ncbi:DUF2142 domain-containing protein [Ruminococcaceae bacterium OttesenSCG-928-D13]|nr:DUF2142 domain-containing protein [Ruminococcaceae bacterium OttesenSCG-928-D13]
MQFVRRHHRYLITAAIFGMCLLIFYVFWHLEVAEARGKSRSLTLNDAQQSATAPLEAESLLSQTFYTDEAFHALGVVPLYDGALDGALFLALYDAEGGTLLAEVEGNAAHTLSGQYAVFVFPDPVQAASGVYRAEFSARLSAESPPLSLAKSDGAPAGWQLLENGGGAGGALCLQASVDRIGGFLTRFYWGFALLCAAFLAGLYLLFSFKVGITGLFAVAAAGLCLLFNLILPPYAAPDEAFHINEAFGLSFNMTGENISDGSWGTSVRRAGDQNHIIQNRFTTVFAYRELADNLFTTIEDSTPTLYQEDMVGGYRLPYLPAALGITVCRWLGLGFVPTLYAGRLINMALYVLAAAFAVKIAPVGKGIFAAVGLLPMAVHLGTSYSRDCLTIAGYLLFTALCLYYIKEKSKLTGKDLIILAVFTALLAPAKIIYAPALLLSLMIPAEKFTWRGKPIPRRVVLALKAGLALLAFAGLAPELWSRLKKLFRGLSAQSAAAAVGVSTAAAAVPNPDSVTFTPADFITRPGTMLWLIVRTFFSEFTFWLESLVGGHLGYFSLPLNGVFTLVCLALLALATLPEPGEESLLLGKRERAFGGLSTLVVAGLLVGGCILWTPAHYTTIYGIQGRYLLPVLPLALCSLSGLGKGLAKTRPMGRQIVLGFSAVGAFALLNAFLLILQN